MGSKREEGGSVEEVKRLGKTVLGMRTSKAKANCGLLFKVSQCIWLVRSGVLFMNQDEIRVLVCRPDMLDS